jgi:hypothetical protein
VAQLGARFHGMEEVIGSIPIRSTNQPNNLADSQNGTNQFYTETHKTRYTTHLPDLTADRNFGERQYMLYVIKT